jgi:fluoride exporter
MKTLLHIALGSGLGGGLRYGIDFFVYGLGMAGFPLSTLFINLSGSLLIGYLAGSWAMGSTQTILPQKWHFWVTGFCGGYTTFSAFSWQVLELVQSSEGTLAGAYAAGSIGLGLIAVAIGVSMARRRRGTQSPMT